MHHSRNVPTGSSTRYLASTAVLLVEVVKLAVSLALAAWHLCCTRSSSVASSGLAAVLYADVFAPDSWKLVVPAALYTLQNSLVYVAISNLEAVTFQVTYQLKILTTVLFSIAMLGRSVSRRQWLALVLLTCGIAMVQVSGPLALPTLHEWKTRLALALKDPRASAGATATTAIAAATAAAVTGSDGDTTGNSTVRGMLAVLAASVISGLTCVYFEKLVKDPLSTVSLWTRNVQLSLFSLVPALLIGVLWQNGAAVARDGFFAGYTPVVWATVALQALGGLVVAVCIAYADNVAKNFAAGLSIVVSYVAGALLFGTPLVFHSTGGAAVVLLAIYLFNSRPTPSSRIVLPLGKERRPDQAATRPMPMHMAYS